MYNVKQYIIWCLEWALQRAKQNKKKNKRNPCSSVFIELFSLYIHCGEEIIVWEMMLVI